MVSSGRTIERPYNVVDTNNNYSFKRGLYKDQYKLRKYPKIAKFVEDKIKNDKCSTDAIIGYMKLHKFFLKGGFTKISVPTIYNVIRYGIINIKIEDTRRMKYNPEYKYKYKMNTSLTINKIPYSIENKPEEINNRSSFSHFEIDNVIGTNKGKHKCLLALTERRIKFEIIFKLSSKTSANVVNKINQARVFMNKQYNKIFKSFSTDNDSEFSDFLSIIKDYKTQIYFCQPYCSGEKGTSEKQNSMIRHFIPKVALIENYSDDGIIILQIG